MKKALLRSLVAILGIIMGGVAGGYVTFHKYAQDYPLVRAFAYLGIFDAVSAGQFDKNSPEAKQELLSTLSLYMQGTKSSAVDPTMKSALRMNCGLVEARLFILANESGDADGAKSYLAKAQGDLKAVGWVDYSEANIRQVVRRQPVSPCVSTLPSTAKTGPSAAQKPCG